MSDLETTINALQDELALSRHYRDDLSVRVEKAKHLAECAANLPGSWSDTLRLIVRALEGGDE